MTRISDLLAKGRTWSFEFFPPKTPEGMDSFDAAVHDLAALEPSFVSITYGAGGSARDTTYDLVVRVNEEQGFPAMPHLTCVGHSRAELVDLLESYRAHGVDNVLALDPANLYAHYNLGLIAQRRGEEAAALRAYDQALEADPDFGPALYNKGILTEGSDLDAAVELYRRAVEADPNFAPAFMRLGFALIHLGRRDEGATYLEKGVGLDPSMANVQAPSYG